MIRKLFVTSVLCLGLAATAAAQTLTTHFKGRYGALEIYDPQTKLSFRVNTPRLAQRMSPCATFQLPQAAIALTTGVIKFDQNSIAFDAARHPDASAWPESWRQNQTLQSALTDSVRWYTAELAQRIGSQRMSQQLARIKYGNADVSGGLDRFWHSSSLRVSTLEQVEFVRAFREGRLGFPQRVVKTVGEALVLERGADYVIRGKYGSCAGDDGYQIGWLVGWAERNGKVWYFGLNLDGTSIADFAGARLPIVHGAMAELGFLPPPTRVAPPKPVAQPAS